MTQVAPFVKPARLATPPKAQSSGAGFARPNLEKCREEWAQTLLWSQEHLRSFFEEYESTCQDIEQEWKKKKKLNYYWQYLNYSKESNFYSIDGTFDGQNSRVNIKISSDTATLQQFPRRKSLSSPTRFRLSSENNSSISRSENENEGMMKSMVLKDRPEGRRKESLEVDQELDQTDLLYCEYVKAKGVYLGQWKVLDKQAIFASNSNMDIEHSIPDEDLRTIVSLSTNEQMRLKKEKKLVL